MREKRRFLLSFSRKIRYFLWSIEVAQQELPYLQYEVLPSQSSSIETALEKGISCHASQNSVLALRQGEEAATRKEPLAKIATKGGLSVIKLTMNYKVRCFVF